MTDACTSFLHRDARPLEASLSSENSAREDVELVRGLIGDDPSAWRDFNARYSRLIYSCAEHIIRRFPSLGPEDVREVYASFCLQLLANDKRKLRRFEAERGTRLGTWLRVLSTNATYDYLRTIRREPCRGNVSETDLLSSRSPDPLQLAEARQRAEVVTVLLSGFSSRDQEFMMLYYGEGLSPEAIAETLGISVKTVYTKKHKIRSRLALALQEQLLAA